MGSSLKAHYFFWKHEIKPVAAIDISGISARVQAAEDWPTFCLSKCGDLRNLTPYPERWRRTHLTLSVSSGTVIKPQKPSSDSISSLTSQRCYSSLICMHLKDHPNNLKPSSEWIVHWPFFRGHLRANGTKFFDRRKRNLLAQVCKN